MGTVSFTTKKEPEIIPEDRSWYKKHCHQCPYLVHDEIFDKENKVFVRCVKPIGESCLAESLLVAQLLLTEQYNRIARRMSDATKPFAHKKIKRRR